MQKLSGDELKIFEVLKSRVQSHLGGNRLIRDYHSSKTRLNEIGFSIPPHMRDFETSIGWAEKAVSVPAARVRGDGFTAVDGGRFLDGVSNLLGEDDFRAKESYAIESAMQYGCSFVFVTPARRGPQLNIIVRSAEEASAEVDPRTGLVTAALEMVNADKYFLYLPGKCLAVVNDKGSWRASAEFVLPFDEYDTVPCTVFTWRPDLNNPFGRSRITRPLRGLTDVAVRTLLRQETTAEYFSAPQRALLGADEMHFTDGNGNRVSPLAAMTGGVWGLPDVFDEDEGKLVRPELVQLSQASMTPHSEMLRSIACMVSSETTIPLGYLGVVHDNPSSAEAILASEADMVAMIESQLPNIGRARSDLLRNIVAVAYGGQTREQVASLGSVRAHFRDPGTPTVAARADAALKFRTAFPDGDPRVAMEIAGLSAHQIDRNLAYARKVSASNAVDSLIAGRAPVSTVDSVGGADELKKKFDALGVAIRAGVKPEVAAAKVGLSGLAFVDGRPITLKYEGE